MITMKKKLITIIVGMMLCAELLGGCGNKNINKDNIETDTCVKIYMINISLILSAYYLHSTNSNVL
jgi:major membrane immunogen (membrane-anchored lipoprotein)